MRSQWLCLIAVAATLLLPTSHIRLTALPAALTTATTITATVLPTHTPKNLDPLDIRSGITYVSRDGVIDIKIPAGWKEDTMSQYQRIYAYTAHDRAKDISTIYFSVSFGDAKNVLGQLNPSFDAGKVHSARELLEVIRAFLLHNPSRYGNISQIGLSTVGSRDAVTFEYQGPIFDLGLYTRVELRCAVLENGVYVLIVVASPIPFGDRIKPLIDDMLDTLILRPEKLIPPTPTDTPTPLPTLTPIPTLAAKYFGNMDPFNFASAMPFETWDGEFSIMLPAGWTSARDFLDKEYYFDYEARPNNIVSLRVYIGTAREIAAKIGLPNLNVQSTDDLSKAVEVWLSQTPNVIVSKPKSIETYQFEGVQIDVTGPALYLPPNSHSLVRVGTLKDGQIILMFGHSPDMLWSRARPVLEAMMKSIKTHKTATP
jgi:hypothetical protein